MIKQNNIDLYETLKERGLSDKEISRELGISLRTCYRYGKEFKNKSTPSKAGGTITVSNYCDAVKLALKGVFETKDDMAEYLGVSAKTLYRYEETYETCPSFCRLFYSQGYSIEKIAGILHISSQKVGEYVGEIRSLDEISQSIEMLIVTYGVLGEFNKSLPSKASELTKIANKLKTL